MASDLLTDSKIHRSKNQRVERPAFIYGGK